ncbi:MAG: V-type ATP synthase subunit E [Planctomycetota bacterium]|jgi:V/A-type H+-transporting ATPase subunit E
MEPVEKGKDALLSGIETDVRAEEREIIAEADKRAAEKRKYTQQKVETILKEAKKDANKQAQEIKSKLLSGVQLEIKRRHLRDQAEVIDDILNRVEKKLFPKIADKDYRSVLIDLITEAAIGLGAKSARVNATQKERKLIDERLLSEAKRTIQTHAGKEIDLKLSDTEPLKNQGVVLTAEDSRTAFNNQIKTRMLRKQRKIQTLIYDCLFKQDTKE